MARFVLRRALAAPTPKEPEYVKIAYKAVPMGTGFYLRPAKYIGICFIKIGPHIAEMGTWDEGAPKQSFAGDELVYPVVRKLKPK